MPKLPIVQTGKAAAVVTCSIVSLFPVERSTCGARIPFQWRGAQARGGSSLGDGLRCRLVRTHAACADIPGSDLVPGAEGDGLFNLHPQAFDTLAESPYAP